MTHDASHSYTGACPERSRRDAENHITKVDGGSTATYGYDVDGRRVSRVVAGVETDYIYDLSGRVVADYGGGCGATCWRVGYIYLNGEMVAEYFGGTYFVHTDHLGSTRLLTGYPTATVVECDDYYPFGEQISCGGTSTTTHKFTGYERDSETGLDNAQARYNSSSLGRFMSPDPIGNFVADATNPQTWNLYTYVNNNPLRFIDPTGYYTCVYLTDDGGDVESTDSNSSAQECSDTGGQEGVADQIATVDGADDGEYPLIGTEGPVTIIRWHVPQPQRSKKRPPQTTGFTLGIRAPGQTYGACMAANANTYSLGGSLELGINVATGTNTNYSQYTSFITGNSINGFLFGSTADAAGTMATSAPGLVSTAMGTATTFGRRTSSIMSLNLAGAGGLPMALSPASAGVKSALGSIGNVLSLGLSFVERTAVDAAFTGAEAINCAIPQ